MSRHAATLLLVQQHVAHGRPEQARAILQRALTKGPAPDLDNAMAVVLSRCGEPDRAAFFAQRAADAAPANAPILTTLANLRSVLGAYDQAIPIYQRALDADPSHAGARLGIANALRGLHRYSDAAEHLRAALEGRRDPDLEATLAATVAWAGRIEEAMPIIRAAAEAFPDHAMAATTLANLSNYDPDLEADEVIEAHLAFGRLADRLMPPPPPTPTPPTPPTPTPPTPPTLTPGGPLRIGLISPDLRRHSVAFFVEPLLRHLPDHGVEVRCYPSHVKGDDVSARLKALAAGWREIGALADADAAARIRDDRLDLLIDLAGHTLGHRLGVLQRRPAPRQATYLGYPSITGLSTCDARIVDTLTDPPADDPGPRVHERLVRIDPPFLCYTPPHDAPDPALPPEDAPITFGCFNTLPKINTSVVSAWSTLLARVPGSRLLLKATQFADPAARDALAARFAAAGTDPRRVEILPATPSLRDHLALYARVHLALDTFPYHGTTTTCEALWQGVPVVTLAGDRHASRVGCSLLHAAGLDDLVARSTDDYLTLAAALAADRPRLADLRASLRPRLRAGPLCDSPGLARRFAAALRSILAHDPRP
ncbi:MAG: tetratricopeptide repeat protein [Phycisphaeraceae bacterium]|nr:MAG: tetratricopeptide repeat protein [Phycisphaeraceae bacterium]